MMADDLNGVPPQWDDLRKCPRQKEVLNEILGAASDGRLPPTSGELADKFHIARARAYSTLEKLLEKGYIEWERTSKRVSRAVRGVRPTRKAWIWRFSQETTTDPDFRHIPVVGEGVGAGNARVPYEDVREYLPLPARHLHGAEAEAFILQVSGDSMAGDDGVLPDDYVVVVPDINPQNGDMAVVIADGQAYVKRLWRDGSTLCLESSNPAYPPIILGEHNQVIIAGKVIGVVRWDIKQVRPSNRRQVR